ncbi:Copper binding protein, plastocyanin/azurin family [Rubellimicrobium mesophilum DSM 19309]|uniref:Copper binding protein, plastocyanin/azurin family n=1 Tax=Rubellimicrobium mesophilum DSM 19309 TaxID=442562 RepID=A0A017HMU1_9RHOB|nr:cupredoxin family copper-binding protein [Rubellimicrobium mesophilum]EYD75817.1 Copper binding protein, plastocyanin/azurin family [Rubellimicrobium mesophilum DSM 19309]
MPEPTRRSLPAGVLSLPFLSSVGQAQSASGIVGMAFSPAELTIAAGQTVSIINQDDVRHTFTADSGAFDIDDLTPGRSVEVTFPTAGTYSYHCAIHPSMKGLLTVL